MSVDKVHDNHSILITDRSKCELNDIKEIICFDEYSVYVLSSMGELEIEGEELKIGNFNSDNGLLSVTGKICGILYNDDSSKRRRSGKKGDR